MQLVTRSGPVVSGAEHVVVTNGALVPGLGVQDATAVGPVLLGVQVITGSTPGALGVHVPASTPAETSRGVQVVLVQLLPALAASFAQAEASGNWVGPVVAVLQLVTRKLASVPGVQAPVGVGPVVAVLQVVVMWFTVSVPAEQLPAATKVGPVDTSAHVTDVYPFASVGVTGTQLPAGTPTVLEVGVQTVWIQALPEVAACGVQEPGTTAATALLLLEQVVTTWVVGLTPEVQLATGVGTVGPVVVQVVAVQALPLLAATSTQLFKATGVGPVVDAAGQEIVTQLLPALPVCATQVPGWTPTVCVNGVQVVVMEPTTPGVQVPTLLLGSGWLLQVVMIQLVPAPPPAVQAPSVGPVVTTLQETTVGPVGFAVQEDTGSLACR